MPDVRDRQTDRQTSDSIIALCPCLLGARKIIIRSEKNDDLAGHEQLRLKIL